MKICDLIQAYTSTSGGIRRYIDQKSEFIGNYTDHEHLIIKPGASDQCHRSANMIAYEIESPYLPNYKPYRFNYRLDKVFSILKEEKPDIIELASPYILPWSAFCFRKLHACKVIGFYHTDFPTTYVKSSVTARLGEKTGQTAESIATQYAKLIYENCDGTIFPSQMMQEKYRDTDILNSKYIPLGVDLDVFHPGQRDLQIRKKYAQNEDDILLIYAGRLDHEKRVNSLMNAFKILSKTGKFSMILVGNGPLKPELLTQAEQNNRLFVLPYQSEQADLARLLASADIYVTAGPHETFALSVIEAQACGLPVVGVRAGALIERIPESVGALAEVNSPEDMAAKIMALSRSDFKSIGQNARKWVESSFSWNSIFNQIFAFYEFVQSSLN
ncbi:glycosyltransferase [candidate division KSB1 bacterium]|nr:glycosyltransferase [candidate division KSB1 bacterium]